MTLFQGILCGVIGVVAFAIFYLGLQMKRREEGFRQRALTPSESYRATNDLIAQLHYNKQQETDALDRVSARMNELSGVNAQIAVEIHSLKEAVVGLDAETDRAAEAIGDTLVAAIEKLPLARPVADPGGIHVPIGLIRAGETAHEAVNRILRQTEELRKSAIAAYAQSCEPAAESNTLSAPDEEQPDPAADLGWDRIAKVCEQCLTTHHVYRLPDGTLSSVPQVGCEVLPCRHRDRQDLGRG